MANLFSANLGKQGPFNGNLAAAGITREMYEAVADDPELAREWAEHLKQHPRFVLVNGMWVQAPNQIPLVQRLNEERSWGFGRAAFKGLETIPAWPTKGRLPALVIEICLPNKGKISGMHRTFDELLEIASSKQEKYWRWPGLQATPERLRLLDGIEHQPGLRWRAIDFAANWDSKNGISPQSVRSPKSPHAAILSAAVIHDRWVRKMDGVNIPFVWAPGYQARSVDETVNPVPTGAPWGGVPELNFCQVGRGFSADASAGGRHDSSYAVPMFAGEE